MSGPNAAQIVRALTISRARYLDTKDPVALDSWKDRSKAYKKLTGRDHPQGYKKETAT